MRGYGFQHHWAAVLSLDCTGDESVSSGRLCVPPRGDRPWATAARGPNVRVRCEAAVRQNILLW